jgi:hypothetical protein
MHTDYLAALKQIDTLLQQLHFTTVLLPKSDSMPIDMLSVTLDEDAQGRPHFMTFTYYPTGEDLEGARLLQLFSQLPGAVDEKNRPGIEAFLTVLNNRTPLGFFGLNDAGAHVIFKYVLAIPTGYEITAGFLSDVMDLCIFVQQTHRDVLDRLATGKLDAQTAINDLLKA